MSNIVEHAREAVSRGFFYTYRSLVLELADEIERLRTEEKKYKHDVRGLEAECERLRAGFEEYACTGSDEPCGCYNEFVRDTAENERLHADKSAISQTASDYLHEIERLQEQLRLLRAALEEIADDPKEPGVRPGSTPQPTPRPAPGSPRPWWEEIFDEI